MNDVVTAPSAPKHRIVATAWLCNRNRDPTISRKDKNLYEREAEVEVRLREGTDGDGS